MNLTERAMLAKLSIKGIWSAIAEDEGASRDLAQQKGIREDIYRAMKRICDPKKIPSLKKFQSSRSTLYNLHRTLTLPWDDRGTRMLSKDMYFDYMTKIGEAKDNMIADYEAFLLELPAIKARFQNDPETRGAYREEDWPEASELRLKVDVRARITPLADAADFRVKLGTEEEEKIRTQVSNDLFTSLAGALVELVGRLKNCVQDTMERLAAYEVDNKGKTLHTFRDTAITNLRELVALVPKLNPMGDTHLNALVKEIETLLCQHDPQTLRDNYVIRQQVVANAGEISRKLAAVEQFLMQSAEAA